jgi:HEAT repeat protein
MRHAMPKLLVLTTLTLAAGCEKEVEYQEKPLSWWIESSNKSFDNEIAVTQKFKAATPEQAKLLVPALATYLEDDKPEVRNAALRLLATLREKAVEAVPAMAKALSDPSDEIRSTAATSLGEIGEAAAPAVPSLVQALKDENEYVRKWSAWALQRIGPQAKAAVPTLASLVAEDSEDSVRQAAVEALGEIGPDAQGAIPALEKALQDPDRDVRWQAAIAIGLIGTQDASTAVPVLIEILQQISDGDLDTRHGMLRALESLGPAARDAVPALKHAQETRDWGFVGDELISEALESIEGPAAQVTSEESEASDWPVSPTSAGSP